MKELFSKYGTKTCLFSVSKFKGEWFLPFLFKINIIDAGAP